MAGQAEASGGRDVRAAREREDGHHPLYRGRARDALLVQVDQVGGAVLADGAGKP